MGAPKTIRFEDELEPKIEAFLKKNPSMKLARLVNLAVEKFINEEHTIELVAIKPKDWKETAKKAFQKHKKAMDELK